MTIYVPPTGSHSLDLVLEQLAGNIGNITANTANIVTYSGNGSISAGGTIIGYRDRYMYVIFADDVYGSNMSTSPVGRLYYGIVNTSDVVAPTNPLNYSFTKISGGFGTTKNLFYKTSGGRNIQWYVGTAAPSTDWQVQPNTSVYNPIDLDAITAVSGSAGANGYSVYSASVFQTSNTVPVAPTGGSFTFSTSTLVPPTGWFANVPTANINVYESSYLFSTNSTDTVTAGLWSNPSAVYRLGANGAPGSNGITTTVGVVYQANTLTPLAISTPGYYDFANTRLIAPTGWSNVIPNNPSNTTIWSSQAGFSTSNASANIANTTSWSTPALTFQSGGAGPAGTRGFIPLAYVITSGDPTLYSQAQYTADFSASRTNTIPPIGTGYAPIAGDTAQFAGLGKSVVKSFDGTNWIDAVGTVIDGSLIVTGTLTAAQMNTNSIYALTMRGGSVNGPNDTSNVGYWLSAGTGSALFTGNVIIGNNLTVGTLVTSTSGIPRLAANTVGGGNIIAGSITATQIAAGSITATQIAANTITSSQIAAGTITADKLAANVLSVGNIVSFNATLGDVNSPGYWLQYTTGDAHFYGNVTIGSNLVIQGILSNGVISTNALPSTQNSSNPAGYTYGNPSNWTQFNVNYPPSGPGFSVGMIASVTYVPKSSYFNVGSSFPNRLITLTFNSTWSDPFSGNGPQVIIYLNGKTFGGTAPINNLYDGISTPGSGPGPSATNPNASWTLFNKGPLTVNGSISSTGALTSLTFTDTSSINRFFNGTNYFSVVVGKNQSSTNFLTTITNISFTVQEI